jgi:hypothetical protein
MRKLKLKLEMQMSIDGYVADANGNTSWSVRLSPREGKIMRQLLENKMAIITGASKGIGPISSFNCPKPYPSVLRYDCNKSSY